MTKKFLLALGMVLATTYAWAQDCQPVNSTDYVTVEQGELPIQWNGQTINGEEDNGMQVTLTSAAGCDSVVTLDLTINDNWDPGKPLNPGMYRLTLTVDDEETGTVEGAGMYKDGEKVSIKATAAEGYSFDHWSDDATEAEREYIMHLDATLTAYFTLNKYAITFQNYDGTTLQESEVEHGEMPAYEGETPEREATAEYTYTFRGWTPEIVVATEEAVYVADYDSVKNEYTITFVNYDNEELQSGLVVYGEMPEYTGETPVREADVQYTYTFKGWEPELVAVTGEATYVAQYDTTVNTYTITFANYDNEVLQQSDVEYGKMPEYTGETPVKEANVQYTYTFKGWEPALVAVTGEATYVAQYDSTVNEYTITFANYDNEVLQQSDVEYGKMPEYTGETPVKEANMQYTYTFKGWEPALVAVTGEATYVAQYDSTVNEYTITFANYDNEVLQQSDVEYGKMPEYTGETPEHEADAQYTYTFKGWEPALVAVTGEATYVAQYDTTVNTYTITFYNYDHTILQQGSVAYGEMPEYMGETPVKEGNVEFSYIFEGWDNEIVPVTGEANYTAVFRTETNKYMISFYNYNNELLQQGEVEYGTMPVYTGTTPAKEASFHYTYSFKAWDPALTLVTGTADYTATFDSTRISLDTVIVSDVKNAGDLQIGLTTHIIITETGHLVVDEQTEANTLTMYITSTAAAQITDNQLLSVHTTDMVLRLHPTASAAERSRWYAFAVPFEVSLTNGVRKEGATKTARHGSDFMMMEYDGALRASDQDGWVRLNNDATLKPGRFYMMAVNGTQNTWRMTMAEGTSMTEKNNVAVSAYPTAQGMEHHAGWNGIANTIFKKAVMTLANVPYATLYHNEYNVYEVVLTPYEEVSANVNVWNVAQPMFVQAVANDRTWFTSAEGNPNDPTFGYGGTADEFDIAPRARVEGMTTRYQLNLAADTKGAYSDHAFLTIAQSKQDRYEIGKDLDKMQASGTTVPQIWIEAYDRNLAAHEIALTSTEIVPLGMSTPAAGDYCFSLSEEMEGAEVELLHNGMKVNALSNKEWILELEKGENSGYMLQITRRELPTDIDNTHTETETKKYVQNGVLYIQNAEKTYNAQGALMQ